jgi:hypothetical protein
VTNSRRLTAKSDNSSRQLARHSALQHYLLEMAPQKLDCLPKFTRWPFRRSEPEGSLLWTRCVNLGLIAHIEFASRCCLISRINFNGCER